MEALCYFDLGRELLTRRPRLKAEIESIHTAGLPMRLSGMSEAGWPLRPAPIPAHIEGYLKH